MKMTDNRGNIVVEIALVLIITLLITGIVVNSSELMISKAITTTERQNTEMLISEVVDNLVNNPGTPKNWEKYDKGTPGLAIINEEGETIPNSVSYSKITTLSKLRFTFCPPDTYIFSVFLYTPKTILVLPTSTTSIIQAPP